MSEVVVLGISAAAVVVVVPCAADDDYEYMNVNVYGTIDASVQVQGSRHLLATWFVWPTLLLVMSNLISA